MYQKQKLKIKMGTFTHFAKETRIGTRLFKNTYIILKGTNTILKHLKPKEKKSLTDTFDNSGFRTDCTLKYIGQ
jgi:hypothetical protein